MGNVVPSCSSTNQVDRNDDKSSSRLFTFAAFENSKSGCDDKAMPDHVGFNSSCATNSSERGQLVYQTLTEARVLNVRGNNLAPSIQLLDSVQVAHVLLEQAEELMRREAIYEQQNLLDNLENLLHEDDESDDDESSSSFASTTSSSSSGTSSSSEDEGEMGDDGHLDDDESRDVFSNLTETTTTDLDSRLDGGRSMATRTVLTTGTAVTQQAKNLGSTSVKKRRDHQRKDKWTPGHANSLDNSNEQSFASAKSVTAALVLAPNTKASLLDRAGKFAASQLLQSHIDSAQDHRSSSFPVRTPTTRACGIASSSMMLWENCSPSMMIRKQRERSSSGGEGEFVQERVQRHMSALYLKLPSRCAMYVKKHFQLKRLLPANPVSRAHVLAAQPTTGTQSSANESVPPHQWPEQLNSVLLSGSSRSADFDVLAALSSSSTTPAVKLLTMSTSSSSSDRDETCHPSAPSTRNKPHFDSHEGVYFGTRAGPISSPVRTWVTDQVFLDLSLTGSVGWAGRKIGPNLPRFPKPQAIGASPPVALDRHLVLLNRRSFVPLVVCRAGPSNTQKTENTGGPPEVGVYATKRRFSGQHPVATTRQWNLAWSSSGGETDDVDTLATSNINGPNLPLYQWAKIQVDGCYPTQVRYSVFMTRDSSSELSFLATSKPAEFEACASYVATHESFSLPEIVVLGRSRKGANRELNACAVVSLCHEGSGDSQEACEDEDDIRTRLSISSGTDPALMVCLAAVIDEFMEKSLRIQSRGLVEAVYRRNQRSI